jgi:D-glycero-alpha-D-manno-heptose-7-phosphate kinase
LETAPANVPASPPVAIDGLLMPTPHTRAGPDMIVRSKAPLRISFGGGGTDVPPYPKERGGITLNTTINKYAYTTLIPLEGKEIRVTSLDYDIVAKYRTDRDLAYDGELDLVKATLKRLGHDRAVHLYLHSDAPPGSGLGSSSTMCVALVAAFQHFLKLPMTDYELADMAYRIEREELGIAGGLQDQYAATFGGFNLTEFLGDRVIVNPLRIRQDTLNELEYRLLLCYTGATRLSANILKEQTQSFVEKRKDVVDSLDYIKELAISMKNALLRNELDQFGDLLHQGWMHKRRLASAISNPGIDALYQVARDNGALGGKLLGAGGGGYLLLFCEFDTRHIVAERLEAAGGQLVDFGFEKHGVQTWEVPGGGK